MAIDPVCGMQVDEKQSAGNIVHDNHTYYFCSPDCLNKFRANPIKYSGISTAHTAAHLHHTGGTMQKAEAASERMVQDLILPGVFINEYLRRQTRLFHHIIMSTIIPSLLVSIRFNGRE